MSCRREGLIDPRRSSYYTLYYDPPTFLAPVLGSATFAWEKRMPPSRPSALVRRGVFARIGSTMLESGTKDFLLSQQFVSKLGVIPGICNCWIMGGIFFKSCQPTTPPGRRGGSNGTTGWARPLRCRQHHNISFQVIRLASPGMFPLSRTGWRWSTTVCRSPAVARAAVLYDEMMILMIIRVPP